MFILKTILSFKSLYVIKGIVANSFYDPNINKKVNFLSNDNSGLDARWWDKAEPVWLSAKNQGLKTFSFFWTGSEVLILCTNKIIFTFKFI